MPMVNANILKTFFILFVSISGALCPGCWCKDTKKAALYKEQPF